MAMTNQRFTLKRSAAALCIVAGLLAAAAPAGALRQDIGVFDAIATTLTAPVPTASFGGGLSRENFIANGP
jgi:hypothetical protein